MRPQDPGTATEAPSAHPALDALLGLVDAYAEARLRQGHSAFDTQTRASRDALAAAIAAALDLPAGHVVVPLQPTAAMLANGHQAWADLQAGAGGQPPAAEAIYRAMVGRPPPATPAALS